MRKSFEITGIYPFNRDRITPDMTAPSLPTSISTIFPVQQPSPVKAIVAAMSGFNPLLNPAFNASIPVELSPFLASEPEVEEVVAPSQPHCERHVILDPNIDPSLQNPCSCYQQPSTSAAQVAISLLRGTSCSFLTNAEPVQPEHTLPDLILYNPSPVKWKFDLNCATNTYSFKQNILQENMQLKQDLLSAKTRIQKQNYIIEQNNAQLVLQNNFVLKIKNELHAKQKPKKKERTINGGNAFIATQADYITMVQEQEEKIQQAKQAKQQKKQSAQDKKQQKQDADARFKAEKMIWEREMQKWSQKAAELRALGVKVKDLPAKPVKPVKKNFLISSDTTSIVVSSTQIQPSADFNEEVDSSGDEDSSSVDYSVLN